MAFITSTFAMSAAGDVDGPASATDNAIARYDGATGKIIQNSGVILDDSNNITGVASLTVTTLVATTTVTTGDNIIVLNDDAVGAPSEDAGIEVERGSSTNASLTWDETSDFWTAGLTGAEAQILLAGDDHGLLGGLLDDDHTQYLTETRHDALAADNPHSVTFTQAVAADGGTDITAAEAETLTDGSNANALHVHAGAGDVVGPASSTDNAVARYDSTTGKLLQDSGVIIDDSDSITGVEDLTAAGDLRLSEPGRGGSSYTGFTAPALAGNVIYTLPTADGSAGEVLSTSGAGALSWVASTGISGNREIFFATDISTTPYNNYRTTSVGSNDSNRFCFHVPADFSTLVSIELIFAANGGTGGTGKDIDLDSDYGAVGESSTTHSESDTTSTYDVGTLDEWQAIDVSAVFSSLAAGDICGLLWDNQTIGTTLRVRGLRLKYSV